MKELFNNIITKRDSGNYAEAINLCYKMIDEFPLAKEIVTVYTVLGGMLYEKGAYSEALIILSKGKELKMDSELISLSIYLSYVKLEEYSKAISELDSYLTQYTPDMYLDTLTELRTDIANSYATDYLYLLENHFNKWLK